MIFNKIIEYPLVVILSVAIIPTVYATSEKKSKTDGSFDSLKQFVRKDLIFPVGLLFLTLLIGFALSWVSDAAMKVRVFFTILTPLLLSIRVLKFKPVRFALCLEAVAIGSSFLASTQERVLLEERNFFGAVRITDDPEQNIRTFYNGTTVHGRQSLSSKKRCEPISYYHRSGPLGQVMELANTKLKPKNVAVIGLGVGTVTTYKKPGQNWKLYDINPAVIRIARDPRYFSLLSKCNDFEEGDFVFGDGRKMLEKEVDGKFDAIIIDAFNSDSIPVHLITSQAFDLYQSKLAKNGIIVLHISNRIFNLKKIVGNLAVDKNLNALYSDDYSKVLSYGNDPAGWIVLTEDRDLLSYLKINPDWLELSGAQSSQVWTDDYSNILEVLY